MHTVIQRNEYDSGAYIPGGSFDAMVDYEPSRSGEVKGCVNLIELEEGIFLATGCHATNSFSSKPEKPTSVGYLSVEEGHMIAGMWHRGRVMNGHEKTVSRFDDTAHSYLITLYEY